MRSLLATFIVALAIAGQASSEPEAGKGRHVRFLAVGEPPPFRQDVRDGIRYELEPPAGSIPPRSVVLGFGGDESQTVSLRLGRISAPLKVPAGTGTLLLKRSETAGDADTWLNLTRPESGDFLVLLWRDARVGTWEKVRSVVLPDDPVNRPAGGFRVVNLSPASVRMVIGDEKLVLKSLKSFGRTLPTGVEQPFHVLLPDLTGNWKPLHTGVIVQNPGERSLVLVYRADGESPRRPIKVSVQREPAPPLPKPD